MNDTASALRLPAHTAPTSQLRLALLRCTLSLLQRATRLLAPLDELLARFPGLQVHVDAAATSGLDGLTLEAAVARLDERLWGAGSATQQPLARLRDALALDAEGLDTFLLCVLADEDLSLGPLIEALRGHDGRPTRACLPATDDDRVPVALDRLLAAGFVTEQSVGRWRVLAVPPAVWQAAQGNAPGWAPPQALPRWSELILPPGLQSAAQHTQVQHAPEHVCWALRGPAGSGRRALAGALARSAGLGRLEAIEGEEPLQLAARATLLGAMPLLTLSPAAGEQLRLPPLPGLRAPLAVKLPLQGGLAAEGRVLRWLELPMPDLDERRRHWRMARRSDQVDEALVSLRLPRGHIHRIAAQTRGDDAATVAAEVDAQGRFLLDGLAQRVPPLRVQESLEVGDELQQEFDLLLARCRHREALHGLLPAAFGHAGATGVRALFKGLSGTGKTLAARQLAAALRRPLYRVDLAATVSKYIGETERNLERVFEAAETLDIVLLLDEGDALMAGRTGVSNANDRYANLETNYLLQRLERYDGVLVVTTNAADRIDPAFARRMDVTLEFAPPDAQTRHRLWCAHLPAGHAVEDTALDELALRCTLTGGQIRNAALQATLLALERRSGAGVGVDELATALRREYRRAGQACPSLSFGAWS
ncbi:ATP-binding protein [Aquabacterium sp. A7-Y]|uniref:AAA family ATPase n=1 Tax=Aquabacterium sp. A7-Y TaxID=1349605 RepID=UPI00223E7BA2|nr:ATP-binding protein [Aquabacterium sp. A7-Y]MCW7541379.1 ATP-binding protein [Aquabacterium sp. A7-Y]